MHYQQTQTGWFLIVIFLLAIVLLWAAHIGQFGSAPSQTEALVMTLFLLVLISQFYQMTTRVEKHKVKIIFGLGLIRITYRMDELISTETVSVPLMYGIGIRITPMGWYYSVQKSKAVRVYFRKNGKQKSFMVGSGDPEGLRRALEEVLK